MPRLCCALLFASSCLLLSLLFVHFVSGPKVTRWFFRATFAFYCSLKSVAVRVPHNISRRVCESHGPNPWPERFRSRFIVKPFFLLFIYKSRKFFSGKTNGFFTFFNFSLHLHKEHYKTNGFFTFLHFFNKTIGFLAFLSENTIKPIFFQQFWSKTQ